MSDRIDSILTEKASCGFPSLLVYCFPTPTLLARPALSPFQNRSIVLNYNLSIVLRYNIVNNLPEKTCYLDESCSVSQSST